MRNVCVEADMQQKILHGWLHNNTVSRLYTGCFPEASILTGRNEEARGEGATTGVANVIRYAPLFRENCIKLQYHAMIVKNS